MSRGPDAGTLLARALERHGPEICVMHRDCSRWASATFGGARHSITAQAPQSARLDAWLEALPEASFDLRGHLVADIDVVSVGIDQGITTIAIEALTVEVQQ